MVGSLGGFFEVFNFGLQILQMALFAFAECSLGRSVLGFAFLIHQRQFVKHFEGTSGSYSGRLASQRLSSRFLGGLLPRLIFALAPLTGGLVVIVLPV